MKRLNLQETISILKEGNHRLYISDMDAFLRPKSGTIARNHRVLIQSANTALSSGMLIPIDKPNALTTIYELKGD